MAEQNGNLNEIRFVASKRESESLMLYESMRHEGYPPNHVTIVTIHRLCIIKPVNYGKHVCTYVGKVYRVP